MSRSLDEPCRPGTREQVIPGGSGSVSLLEQAAELLLK